MEKDLNKIYEVPERTMFCNSFILVLPEICFSNLLASFEFISNTPVKMGNGLGHERNL